MLFNLEAQPEFGAFTDTLLAQMQAQRANTDALVDQAKAGVSQLQLQQDAISKVDVNEEQAQLLAYTRAYEASVRAMAALDECLNVLINRMAASSFTGASTSSVLTS
jgi:flagellar hook-associated protein FlgK